MVQVSKRLCYLSALQFRDPNSWIDRTEMGSQGYQEVV